MQKPRIPKFSEHTIPGLGAAVNNLNLANAKAAGVIAQQAKLLKAARRKPVNPQAELRQNKLVLRNTGRVIDRVSDVLNNPDRAFRIRPSGLVKRPGKKVLPAKH